MKNKSLILVVLTVISSITYSYSFADNKTVIQRGDGTIDTIVTDKDGTHLYNNGNSIGTMGGDRHTDAVNDSLHNGNGHIIQQNNESPQLQPPSGLLGTPNTQPPSGLLGTPNTE